MEPRKFETRTRKVWRNLHPFVYLATVLLFAWMILVGWISYAVAAYSDMVIAVATAFTVVAFGTPALLACISRAGQGGKRRPSLREWAEGYLETRTGRLPSKDAAAQVLLVPASVGLAFAAIGLVAILTRLAG